VSTFPRRSDQSAPRPAPQISEERRQTVETARQSWIRKLIDLSRRNNLLHFRPLKTGTLELTSASSERLRDLLGGESVSAAKLLPNLEADLLAKILRDISRRALENSEEKGLSTLFVTFGMATWPALDGGRPGISSLQHWSPVTVKSSPHISARWQSFATTASYVFINIGSLMSRSVL
jgi:hypothetical protein